MEPVPPLRVTETAAMAERLNMIHTRRNMLRLAALGVGSLAFSPMPLIPTAQAAIGKVDIPPSPKALRFRVLWKGDEIGHHNVTITPTDDGDGMTVVTNIRMKVKVGPFTAFRFEHDSTEAWRNGLLQSLVSKTHDDGDDLTLNGKATATGFKAIGPKGAFTAPADVLTTNCMWLPELVDEKKIIDVQKGQLVSLESKPLGEEHVVVKGKDRPAERHSIRTPFVGGSLWYDLAGNWVRSRLEIKGETLEYSLVA
jgi:Family of unknown function (DUF6134)